MRCASSQLALALGDEARGRGLDVVLQPLEEGLLVEASRDRVDVVRARVDIRKDRQGVGEQNRMDRRREGVGSSDDLIPRAYVEATNSGNNRVRSV